MPIVASAMNGNVVLRRSGSVLASTGAGAWVVVGAGAAVEVVGVVVGVVDVVDVDVVDAVDVVDVVSVFTTAGFVRGGRGFCSFSGMITSACDTTGSNTSASTINAFMGRSIRA
jgi:hypothetical protein